MKLTGPEDLPENVFAAVTERNIGQICITKSGQTDEQGIRGRSAGFFRRSPDFRQGEPFRRILVRRDRQFRLQCLAFSFEQFGEQLPRMAEFFLKTALVFVAGDSGMVFVKQSAQHPAQQFALIAHRTLDQCVDLAGAVSRPARSVRGPDIENPLLQFVFAAAGAHMRQLGKTFDCEHHILFAVHHWPFQREFHLRIGKTVDESADLGGIEGLQFLLGQTREQCRSPALVFADSDHHISAFGIGQRHTVTGEFGSSGP